MNETKTVWHPYPETQPNFYEPVLITMERLDGSRFVAIDLLHLVPYLSVGKCWSYETDEQIVVAWAELPEPYTEKVVDMHQDAVIARKYLQGDPETLKILHIFYEKKDEYR